MSNTFGFSTMDGIPMGTRCGALDAGIVLYLLEECNMTVAGVTQLLYKESGLLGVSGISSDMRELLENDSPQAREAVDLFVYRVYRTLGEFAAVLQGLDVLVFTGGIGQHAHQIRQEICQQATWLGVHIDEAANERGESCISQSDSPVSVWVIPTNEELMIARHTFECCDKLPKT
jgi:acetate kinase